MFLNHCAFSESRCIQSPPTTMKQLRSFCTVASCEYHRPASAGKAWETAEVSAVAGWHPALCKTPRASPSKSSSCPIFEGFSPPSLSCKTLKPGSQTPNHCKGTCLFLATHCTSPSHRLVPSSFVFPFFNLLNSQGWQTASSPCPPGLAKQQRPLGFREFGFEKSLSA